MSALLNSHPFVQAYRRVVHSTAGIVVHEDENVCFAGYEYRQIGRDGLTHMYGRKET